MTDYAMFCPEPGGPERFERRAVELPEPGPGEVRLRQTAVGLNFLDVYHRSGAYKWPVERDLVPGSEAAGVVEAVGPGVTSVAPGDRVAYAAPLNAYASARLIPADRLVRVPDAIPDEVAATVMLKGMTAHYLIHATYRVEPGMTVLVHAAAGGVGLILGQWLAAKGATAIGTAGGPEKVALARAHGYAHVIDYRAEDFAARVREITEGRGVHVVYDSVGRDTWRGSLACLRVRGMFACFGQSSGPVEGFAPERSRRRRLALGVPPEPFPFHRGSCRARGARERAFRHARVRRDPRRGAPALRARGRRGGPPGARGAPDVGRDGADPLSSAAA